MCRLAAIIKNDKLPLLVDNKLKNIFTHMLYINSYNNVDGTGVMCQSFDNHKWSGHKRSVPSPDFINSRWYQKTFLPSFSDQQFLAGHTRYSTVGVNSDENSHPFLHGSYFLMQNGTALSNSHANLVAGKPSPHAVDSENVAWAFAQQGVKKTLEAYKGEGVLMYLDKAKKTFNIIKNDKRQLHFAMVKDHNVIIIATESSTITLACERAGLEIEPVESLADDVHHIFYPDGDYSDKPQVINSYSQTSYYGGGTSSWDKDSVWSQQLGRWVKGPPKPHTKTNTTPPEKSNKVIVLKSPEKEDDFDLELDESYKGKYVDKCMNCGTRIYESDKIFLSEGFGVCSCENCVDIIESTYDISLTERK